VACGGDDAPDGFSCGPGTVADGGQCVVGVGAGGAAGLAGAAGTGGAAGASAGVGGGGNAGSGAQAGTAGIGGSSATAGNAGAAGSAAGGGANVGGGGPAGAAGSGAGAAGANSTGDQPPTFAGVAAVAPSSSTSLFVAWKAASDDLTPASKISYRIFASTQPGVHDFTKPTAIAPPGATSAELFVGIVAGNDYYVVVRAVDEAGHSDDNVVEKTTQIKKDETAPVFAGITTATTAGPAAVTVAWNAAQDDLTPTEGIVYYVYGGPVAGPNVLEHLVGVSEPGASSFVVKQLANADAPTFFTVRARDGGGNVDTNTKQASALPGKDTNPPTFAGCTGAVTNATGGIDVVWEPASDDGTAPSGITYEVYASTVPEAQNFTAPPAGTVVAGTFLTLTGLAAATDYYVVCRARDASGNQDKNLSQKGARTPDDIAPPTFAGVEGVANLTTTSLELTWTAAVDEVTSTAQIVYDVYQASEAGMEDFTAPTLTTAEGATSAKISGLATGRKYFFVVRARDKAGNREANVVEAVATTRVSFKGDVQPIFTASCALAGCHSTDLPQSGLILSPGFAYNNLVLVSSTQAAPLPRVQPGDPGGSYLEQKLVAAPGIVGDAMPPNGTTPLTDAQKATINQWIAEGASIE
jgi:hypothetical protein